MPDSFLTITILSPFVGILIILLLKGDTAVKIASAITTAVTFIFSLHFFYHFNPDQYSLQFVHKQSAWITSGGFSIDLHFGLDGIALLLFVLTAFLFFISSVASWNYIQKRNKEFYINLLLLEIGVLGVFASANLVLFYVFWELMLIPMALLIGVWGGERRLYAAIKFFLYTMAGSVLMLAAILILYHQYGTLSIEDLSFTSLKDMSPGMQLFLFFAFAISFAIKIPVFPVHTWLPDAHTEAPMAGSVILAGVLLKMGTYGFIRFCIPFFPIVSAEYREFIIILSVIGIIYGAWVATVQKDGKKLIAYSSVSHLGFCLLGLMTFTEEGVAGGMIQMVNHGISTGMLFLLIGMIYERTHTRMIDDYGGLAKSVPVFTVFFIIAMLSSVGLPGMNGFVGEFLVLLGAFKVNIIYGLLAGTGVVWAAVYLLLLTKKMFFGEIKNPKNKTLQDLSPREISVLVPMVILIFWFGLYPQSFFKYINPSVRVYLNSMTEEIVKERTGVSSGIGGEKTVRKFTNYETLGKTVSSYEDRLGQFTIKGGIPAKTNQSDIDKKLKEIKGEGK